MKCVQLCHLNVAKSSQTNGLVSALCCVLMCVCNFLSSLCNSLTSLSESSARRFVSLLLFEKLPEQVACFAWEGGNVNVHFSLSALEQALLCDL